MTRAQGDSKYRGKVARVGASLDEVEKKARFE